MSASNLQPTRSLDPARSLLLRALAPAALLALVPAALASQAGEGARGGSDDAPGIVGVVIDGETGEPLAGVTVTLRPLSEISGPAAEARLATTDAEGRFAFRGLPDGSYGIELEHVGYRTLADSVYFRVALGLRVEAEMVREAVEMEPLLVAVEARSRRLEASGFYGRRDRGFGQFLSREEIEDRDPLQVTDLLATMPGVRRVRPGGMGERTDLLMRGGCVPEVFLDGVRAVRPFSLDASLRPDDVAGIEVYHGAELPARYSVSGCGAVLVWTRVPEPDEMGSSWRWERILPALGFVGAIFLLLN